MPVSEIYRVPNVAIERYDEVLRSVNKWSDVIIGTYQNIDLLKYVQGG